MRLVNGLNALEGEDDPFCLRPFPRPVKPGLVDLVFFIAGHASPSSRLFWLPGLTAPRTLLWDSIKFRLSRALKWHKKAEQR